MNTYTHPTLYELEKIMVFHALGKTITQIAQQLQRHKSTISRELKRCQGEYVALSAQQHYYQQREECKPKRKLADPRLFDVVKRRFFTRQQVTGADCLSFETRTKLTEY